MEARTEQWRRQLEGADRARESVIYLAEEVADHWGVDPASRIVGFESAGPHREEGSDYGAELYAIYLLAEYQGAGVGRELVRRVASFLRRHGFESMLVWVLKNNPAERFYERLGGERLGQKSITIGGAEYQEVAFGWRSLALLS